MPGRYLSYLVTDGAGERRVLRVYARDKHWIRSDTDLLFELELLDYLASAGLPVSRPFPRRGPGDRLLGRVEAPEGGRRFALFAFARGRPADDRPLRLPQLELFGGTIARLHAAMDGFRSDHDRYQLGAEALIDLPLRTIADNVTSGQDECFAELSDLARRLRAHVAALEPVGPAYGLIHGDIRDGNVHVTAEGDFVLLDFDLCGFGWRAYELSNYYRSPEDPADERVRWAAVLRGYEGVRALDRSERDALPTLAACRELWDVGDLLRDARLFGDSWAVDGICQQALDRVRSRLATVDR